MNQKSPDSWSSPFKYPLTSEMFLISHKPALSSLILPKHFVFIFYFILTFASSGYIILSVYIFQHSTKQLLFDTQLKRKKFYFDYYTLLSDSIEQLFINTLCLPQHLKTIRSLQRCNTLHEQCPAGSFLSCPTSGWISSHFGMRTDPIFEGTAFHKGIDIAAPEGTPVYCAADGIVEFCGFKPLLGNAIYIRHPQTNLITVYGHLLSCTISKNKKIQRGQQLGLVGSTGKSTGPHLHFEVRHFGIPINPILNLVPLDTLLD